MRTDWKRILALTLLLCLLPALTGCGGKEQDVGFAVLSQLNDEQFNVAFRTGDPLRELVSAALEEIAAEGLLSRLSSQYLEDDYSCLEGVPGALEQLGLTMPEGRALRVGVQDGAAPLCWRNDSGDFIGLIPDLVNAAAKKLGCPVVYCEVRMDNISAELGSGNVDCAWLPASFPESANYALSPAWMENTHLLIVRENSGIHRPKDLRNHNIGVTDDTGRDALKVEEKLYPTVTIWNYEDIRSCFTALSTGDCDAVIVDSIAYRYYLRK